MGSNCCKNVRVTSVPQEEPIQLENNNVTFIKSPAKIETTVAESPPPPPPPPANDSKLLISCKLPPIRRFTKNSEGSGVRALVSTAPIDELTELNIPSSIIRLSQLHPSLNDEHLLESVSDESLSSVENPSPADLKFFPHPKRDDDRFLTSTPIPATPELDESENDGDDDEHREYLNELLGPLSNQNDSDLTALSLSQILRLREQLSIEEYFKSGVAIPDLKLSPQSLFSLDEPGSSPITGVQALDESDSQSLDDPTIYLSDTSLVPDSRLELAMKIDLEHPEAFDEEFNVKRQHVIENSNYRLIVEAWRPTSIAQLVEQIRNFTRNRPTLDRLWMIFYWMARNIDYDTAPYVGKKHVEKSPESVFRTRKANSDGYANLFQRLCDEFELRCEKINGYSKSYVFELCNRSSVPVDHAWNAVQINEQWYFIELTWSVGYLESSQLFKREFNSYFFLTRPNELIYHHFPAEERWQLLKQPIQMAQYMQMPKIWPSFFQNSLLLFSPANTLHVDLLPQQSFALILIQSPRSVTLAAHFSLNGKEIDGGSRLLFDARKRLYRCFFAPNALGVHIVRLLVKNESSQSFSNAIEFELNVKQLPAKVISYPKTSKCFDEWNLEILSPCNTHLIRMDHGDTHAEILIRAPIDVELLGRLTSGENGTKIQGGQSTFIDRRQNLWRCLFAPPADGPFDAFVLAESVSIPTRSSSR